MNERIRELVRQAGLDDADFPIENWDNVPLAKFAQLILEDAMSICEDLGDKGMDGHYCVDAIAKKYQMRQWS